VEPVVSKELFNCGSKVLRFVWGQDYSGSNVEDTLKARTQERKFWSSLEITVKMERRQILGPFLVNSTGFNN